MRYLLIAAALIALHGCGDGKLDAAKQLATRTDTTVAIDLASHDLPLMLTPPDKQFTGGQEPSVMWQEETGKWAVRAGDHFGLTIMEEPGDIPRLKADLDRDLLKKNTVLKETPDLLLFRSEFPDDPTLVFIHYYQVVKAAGRVFAVQDIDGVRFTQQDVDRMVASINPKQPA